MRQKFSFKSLQFNALFLGMAIFANPTAGMAQVDPNNTLKYQYEQHSNGRSDINEHLPTLRRLSMDCSSVIEIGIRGIVSTWGILQGLSENSTGIREYIGIDINSPPSEKLKLAQTLANDNGINFLFWQANDMTIQIPEVDMLFIDTIHTYCHLTYELETFSPQVQKYISMHDTSEPWGTRDDQVYYGNYSEYPASYDRTKRGLWAAVEDFLKNHPEWELKERYFNNHGFTVLQRVY